MPYSELAYFEGYHFAHIAEWEHRLVMAKRLKLARDARAAARKRAKLDLSNPVHAMQSKLESRFALRSCA
jgi:hypothetical protein